MNIPGRSSKGLRWGLYVQVDFPVLRMKVNRNEAKTPHLNKVMGLLTLIKKTEFADALRSPSPKGRINAVSISHLWPPRLIQVDEV